MFQAFNKTEHLLEIQQVFCPKSPAKNHAASDILAGVFSFLYCSLTAATQRQTAT